MIQTPQPRNRQGGHMRSPFDPIYKLTSFLAVLALIAIAGIILADVTLRQFGGQVRSSDDFAGFALAATGFLGLAATYRRGEHIRVGLIVDRLTGARRKAMEFFALSCGIAATGWATWWIGRLVYDSWRFNELTMGLVPIHLWVPQSALLFGLAVLLLAMCEDFVRLTMGKTPSYLASAEGEFGENSLADR
jgi:TRAP-type C4-dicarboxylate transport system permease small subunit